MKTILQYAAALVLVAMLLPHMLPASFTFCAVEIGKAATAHFNAPAVVRVHATLEG